MTEIELNVLFNITPERIQNVYSLNSGKNVREIQKIIKIFEIANKQRSISKSISARSLAPFREILISNN